MQPRSVANEFGLRRHEKETGTRVENKSHSVCVSTGSKGGVHESHLHERLVSLSICLIGHQVEVNVEDGSSLAGVFHAINAEKDFGIILKMTRLLRGSSRGHNALLDSLKKDPSRTLIIPAKELVQIIAKDILLDSSICQSLPVEVERKLERWVPDEDTPQNPELENILDDPRNRRLTITNVKLIFDKIEGAFLQIEMKPRSAAIGFGLRRQRQDKETGTRVENKSHSAGVSTGSKGGVHESHLHERLVYLSTCLIGHHVEVHVKDGSSFSGVFHATNAEKDFGVILKMTRLPRGSSRGHKALVDSLKKDPSRTLIIPAKELVQIIAKLGDEAQKLKADDSLSSLRSTKDGSDKGTLSPNASACSPSPQVPSKELKFSRDAKTFIPPHTPRRPASPVADGSFYYPPNTAAVSRMHDMPVGNGDGPKLVGYLPVIWYPVAAPMQSPQAYFDPNGPQYGQQSIPGHLQNVLYMPTYYPTYGQQSIPGYPQNVPCMPSYNPTYEQQSIPGYPQNFPYMPTYDPTCGQQSIPGYPQNVPYVPIYYPNYGQQSIPGYPQNVPYMPTYYPTYGQQSIPGYTQNVPYMPTYYPTYGQHSIPGYPQNVPYMPTYYPTYGQHSIPGYSQNVPYTYYPTEMQFRGR